MSPVLVVLLLALIGLVGARLTFSQRRIPLGPRIFLAIGGPFLFLGFALGPHVAGVLSRETADLLTPMLALGLGWIGVLFGLQLDRTHLRQFPTRYLTLTLVQALVTLLIVYAAGTWLTTMWSDGGMEAVILAAAATASVSTPAAIALISNTYMARGRLSRLLFYVASLDAVVGIAALGVTHAARHVEAPGVSVAMSSLEWLTITVLLGLFFGVLFLSLTRIRPRSQELILLLIGLVLFAAGTAFYLGLSPLLVCTITGAVIANLSPMRRRVYVALSQWEKPIYIMLLVLAGALLQFSSWWIVPLVMGYAVVRLLGKWAGGLAARLVRLEGVRPPRSFGLALAAQGGLALAMAISFVLIYVPEEPGLRAGVDIFFAALVIAVGISDLVGPFLARMVLERAGEIERRLAGAADGWTGEG